MKIIFHINENSKWKSVLDNISNVIDYCNESKEMFKIEVVANGDAIMTLKNQAAVNLNIISNIRELYEKGAVFAACRNSLKKFAIPEEELITFVETVPSGVIEIVKKEEEGYSYIKP